MKKVKFVKDYGAFTAGEIHELRDVFVKELIQKGAAVLEPPNLEDIGINAVEAGRALRVLMKTLHKTSEAQRKALIVRSEELAEQIRKFKIMEQETIRGSEEIEPWIKEAFKLDIALLHRTRNFVLDCLEKNRFPVE